MMNIRETNKIEPHGFSLDMTWGKDRARRILVGNFGEGKRLRVSSHSGIEK
jgi:hypothetical protein